MGSFLRNFKLIERNFIPGHLIDICERDERDFEEFGTVTQFGARDFYIYKDNGGSVLGVAHLDSVQNANRCDIFNTKDGGPIVLSPTLDDRLGAWVITDLLPRLGCKIDWLLTTGEESGMSTGADFVRNHKEHGKKYNWMFQFDRTGSDVVLYDYDTPELRAKLKGAGMLPAFGSFSDISAMEDLGCVGFNVGVGYREYHSKRAYAWLNDTFAQVAHFLTFYRCYHDMPMPHEKKKWAWSDWNKSAQYVTYTDTQGHSHTYKVLPKKKKGKKNRKPSTIWTPQGNYLASNFRPETDPTDDNMTDEDLDGWLRNTLGGQFPKDEDSARVQGNFDGGLM